MKKNNSLQAVMHALNGWKQSLRSEKNIRIQLVAMLLVVSGGLYWHISFTEWYVVILTITAVLGAEMMNTAIEKLCNVVSPDFHPGIKIVKDIAAGAVMLICTGGLITGSLIFIPKIFQLFK